MKVAHLRIISVVYLLIPNIIFSIGWFKWQVSVPVSIGLLILLFRELRKSDINKNFQLSRKDILFLTFFSLFWAICCGIGGLGYETNDYWAHNARYNDLYINSWPIYFPAKGRFACYYFGFFLVPALFSKIIHELSVPALFLWTVMGFGLGLSWIYILLNRNKFLLIIFIFVGWLGHPVTVLISRVSSVDINSFPFFLDIWSLFLQSTNVPNQVIPTLIASGILLHDTFLRKTFQDSFFPLTLCFIWSVFPSAILIIIFGLILCQAVVKQKFSLFNPESFIKIILPGLLFLPAFIYLLSSDNIPISGFIWTYVTLPTAILHLSIFVWFTLAILYILTIYFRKRDSIYPLWFINSVYILILLSTCFRMGIMNDWTSRSTITFIIIITVFLLSSFSEKISVSNLRNWKLMSVQVAVLIVLLINHTQFFNYLIHNNYITRKISPELSTSPKIPFDKYRSTYEAVKEHCSENEANQYLGKKNSVYELILSK